MASIEHIQREQFEKCIARGHQFDEKGLLSMEEWIARDGLTSVRYALLRRIESNLHRAEMEPFPILGRCPHLADIVNLCLLLMSVEDPEEARDG